MFSFKRLGVFYIAVVSIALPSQSLHAASFAFELDLNPFKALSSDFTNAAQVVSQNLTESLLTSLREKFLDTVKAIPKAVPSVAEPKKAEPLLQNLPAPEIRVNSSGSIEVVAPRNLPAPAPATPSMVSRVAALESQLASMRELMTRQSDRNVSSVTQIIREVTTGGSSDLSADSGAFSGSVSAGALSIGSATTTAGNGFDISAGCFSVNGVCVGGGTGGGGATFAFPFVTLGTGENSTSTTLVFGNGFVSSASSTLASTTVSTLLSTNATATNLYVSNLSSTTEARSNVGVIGMLSSVFGTFTNILANGSSTFQALSATSATGTNLYATNFLALGSSTFQAFRGTSGTTTNFYTGNFLATASSTFQALFSTSATGTNLYATNFLALGSSTLQAFVASQGTITSATSTNLYATNLLVTGSTTLSSGLNFTGRATTTLTLNNSAWVIATNTAATAAPLMSFNNSAGTSTIQFFGATTTGLTAGTGLGIPMGNFMLIGDGKAPAGLSILKGGLCVDNDGWCTATTSGRISSISSSLGGADIAEMYQAGEYLEAGDVVSILSGISVSKAVPDGKDKMMGVVSTNPGVVLGSGPDREGRIGDVPIALAGRVPVKVSGENGAIRPGDYLMLSSQPGVAAKALKAGTVIGQALEVFSGGGTGKILVFVKNSYYSGLSLDSFPGLTTQSAPASAAILAALESGAVNQSAISSDLTADRMLAAVEIITPKITAGLISVKAIESPTIDALNNRITTEVAALRARIDAHDSALQSLESRVAALESASSTVFSLAAISMALNEIINSASEWVVSKVTAVLGVFERIEVGTARVSKGIEMVDSETGQVYCMTIKNNEWEKKSGPCDSSSPGNPSSPSLSEEPAATTTEEAVEHQDAPAPEEEPAPEPETPTPVDEPAGAVSEETGAN